MIAQNFQPRWKEIWPTLKNIIDKSDGPFIGGEEPNIADLAFLGYLVPIFGVYPSTAGPATDLKPYYEKLTAHLPKHKKYFEDASKFWTPPSS